jgi:hypothetical protein
MRAFITFRRLGALDAAVTAVANAMSALRELGSGAGDGNAPPESSLLVHAAASVPFERSPALQALLEVDEALVQPEPPSKVRCLSKESLENSRGGIAYACLAMRQENRQESNRIADRK